MTHRAPPPPGGLLGGRWNADVRTALLRLITAPHEGEAPVCVLDWDNTCIRGDVGEAALAWLDAADGGHRLAHYEAMIAEHGKRAAYIWCAEAVAGRTETALRTLAWHLWSGGLAAGTLAERPEMRELMWVLQRYGWDVWIVSASQATLVEVAAQRYGISAARVVGMSPPAGADGVLQPDLEGPPTYREGKVQAIEAEIGRTPALAVGDAETDLEMLEQAEHALLIDRGDADLRARAQGAGWWVQPAFED